MYDLFLCFKRPSLSLSTTAFLVRVLILLLRMPTTLVTYGDNTLFMIIQIHIKAISLLLIFSACVLDNYLDTWWRFTCYIFNSFHLCHIHNFQFQIQDVLTEFQKIESDYYVKMFQFLARHVIFDQWHLWTIIKFDCLSIYISHLHTPSHAHAL